MVSRDLTKVLKERYASATATRSYIDQLAVLAPAAARKG